MLLGLGICLAFGAIKVVAYTDSQLIAGQVNGDYEAKDDSIKMYLVKVKEAMAKFHSVVLLHIPQLKNAQADALSRLASSTVSDEPRNIVWEVLPCPSINTFVGGVNRTNSWMDPYIVLLRDGQLPEDPELGPIIAKKANWFEWYNGPLYKNSYTHPLLKCVTPTEGNYILCEIHERACGTHEGIWTLIGKVLRSGYYWPSIKADAENFVKTCEKCQFYGEVPRRSTNYLSPIQVVLPFDRWVIDLLGPFPPASGQQRFVLVAIDYFTKYVEAEALNTITYKKLCQFIWRNIITRYDVLQVKISNNGRQFNSAATREYCS